MERKEQATVTVQEAEELVAIYRNTSNSLAGSYSWQESHAVALEAVARFAVQHADRLGLASAEPPGQGPVRSALADHVQLLAELVARLEECAAILEGARPAPRSAPSEATLENLIRAIDYGIKNDSKGFVAVKEP